MVACRKLNSDKCLLRPPKAPLLMVEDGDFSHKRDYVTNLKEILNLDGHPNRITGSKVTPILLNGWALPIGGASSVKSVRL